MAAASSTAEEAPGAAVMLGILALLVFVVVVGIGMMALYGARGFGMMGFGGPDQPNSYWVFGALMMLVPLAFFAWLIYRLAGARGPAPTRADGPTPMDTARSRYARGDISRAEFEEIAAELRKSS